MQPRCRRPRRRRIARHHHAWRRPESMHEVARSASRYETGMAWQTTCIGAFPKPDRLPNSGWFEIGLVKDHHAEDVIGAWTADPGHDPVFRYATEAAVRLQFECGSDIPTDGEQRRENYVHYQCRFYLGFGLTSLERRVLRGGAYEPAISGNPRAVLDSGSNRSYGASAGCRPKPPGSRTCAAGIRTGSTIPTTRR